MRIWRTNDDATSLLNDTAPLPEPGPGEIRVRIAAAGITPTELHWYPTTHDKSGGPRVRAVPGHEFSGTVDALGDGVAAAGGPAVGLVVGAAVFGMSDWFADGATAEFCLTRPEWVVPKPPALSHAQAASVPISALTAWQGWFDRVRLRRGESVLVHGGSGAVGLYAVQLARRHGARVTTTASARNAGLLARLGAERVIDYRTGRFEDEVRDVDAVFDCVGGETLKRSWAVLGPAGRLVTIAADSEGTADERTKAAFFIVEPNRTQLTEIAGLLERGELEAFVDATVPFEAAGDAYAGKVDGRLGYGKAVVAVTDDRA